MRSGNLTTGRSRRRSLAGMIRERVKRFLSVAVSVSVIACSMPAIPAMAAEDDDDADVQEFTLTVNDLCDAVEEALQEGDPISESAYAFDGEAQEAYEDLFYGVDVYEIRPEIDKDGPNDLSLKVFVRLSDDRELDSVEITGDEEIVFLLLNNSEEEAAARIMIDDYETGLITVAAKTDVAAEGIASEEADIAALSAGGAGSGASETVSEMEEEAEGADDSEADDNEAEAEAASEEDSAEADESNGGRAYEDKGKGEKEPESEKPGDGRSDDKGRDHEVDRGQDSADKDAEKPGSSDKADKDDHKDKGDRGFTGGSHDKGDKPDGNVSDSSSDKADSSDPKGSGEKADGRDNGSAQASRSSHGGNLLRASLEGEADDSEGEADDSDDDEITIVIDADEMIILDDGDEAGTDDISEDTEVDIASSSDAKTVIDGYTLLAGETYDPVIINGTRNGVAYVTTLKDLGIDYGLMPLATASASDAEAFKLALESAEEGDTVALEADIEVDCSDDTYVTMNTAGITADLGGHTIKVKGTSTGKHLFVVRCGGEFVLKNGTVDGGVAEDETSDDSAKCKVIYSTSANNDITVSDITVQNFASNDATFYISGSGNHLTIEDSKFINNKSRAMYSSNCSELIIENSTFSGNKCSNNGAGIYVTAAEKVSISGTTVSDNDAGTFNGAGIYINGSGDVSLSGNTISGNKTTSGNGGGAELSNCTGEILIDKNTITGNTGYRYGGGLYITNGTKDAEKDILITNNIISNNTVYPTSSGLGQGGGIDIMINRTGSKITCTFSDNTITGNIAGSDESGIITDGRGGGISLYNGTEGAEFIITSGEISGNKAAWGGGIDYSYHSPAVLYLYNAMITGNEAVRGGGIWECPTSNTDMYPTFGGAIYGNTAEGEMTYNDTTNASAGDDIRFEGYDTDMTVNQDEPGKASVSARALGGMLIDWYTDEPGARYSDGAGEPADVLNDYQNKEDSFSLHAELNEEGQKLAEAEATLLITGNTASQVGGGIASNGPIVFGDSTSLTVRADKLWKEEDGETDLPEEEIKDYSVDVTLVRIDGSGNEVDLETVTLNADNEWTWNFSDLPTKYTDSDDLKEYEYTYTVRESNARTNGFFDVSVETGEVVEADDGSLDQTVTITNIKCNEPELTKEELEDDYERKDRDIEHDDSNGHFEENIDGDGWGSWDDADNNQEITYRLTIQHIKDTHSMTVHDYLEKGLDFEPDTVEIEFFENEDAAGVMLTEGVDYEVTQDGCSDEDCPMEGCTFEIKFADYLFDPENDPDNPEAEPLDDNAYVVVIYKALTDTHADDYFDDEHEYEDVILNDAYLTGYFGTSMLAFRTTPISTETDLFGFGVYKYADENGNEAALAGAEFILERVADNKYAKFSTETGEDGYTYYLMDEWVDDKDAADILTSDDDGMIRIEGLDDDSYIITEVKAPDGYEIIDEMITLMIDEDGNITVSGNTGSKEAVIGHVVNVENTPPDEPEPEPGTGSLTVSKTVTGAGGSTTQEFTFTVTLSDTSINGTYGDLTFVDGVASFTLRHGESVTATGLPEGIEYTVEETAANGYNTTSESASGRIVAGDTIKVSYINDRPSTTSGGGHHSNGGGGGGGSSSGGSSGGSGDGGPGSGGDSGDSGGSYYPLEPMPETGDPGATSSLLMMVIGLGALLVIAVVDRKKRHIED